MYAHLDFWHLLVKASPLPAWEAVLFASFVILIIIVTMDIELSAPIAAVLAVTVAVPLCRFRFPKSILRVGDGTFVIWIWGVVAPVSVLRFGNAWARAGDVFITRGKPLGFSYLAFDFDAC